MAQQIQLRRDTAANWTSINPILAVGEMGIELVTGQFKVGNGVQTWTALPYGGIIGPQGPQGIQGIQGPIGPEGPPGPEFTPGPQAAGSVYAGPVSGPNADPTFRALTYLDIPADFVPKSIGDLIVPTEHYYVTPSFRITGTLKLEGNATLKTI
jgi:hypothetical protein